MIALLLDNARARRVSMVVVALGLLAIAVMYLSMYPAFEEQMQALTEDMPAFFTAMLGGADLTTAEGYLRSEVYALISPMVAGGVAISLGAALAKAERDVTLTDAYLAPVSRRTLALSHLGTVLVVGLAAGVGVFAGVLIGGPIAGADISLSAVFAATAAFVGLTWAAGTVSWMVGAATGHPGAASGAGWGFLALSFLANSFGEALDSLSVLADVSPWGWYGAGAPITDGFDPSALLLFGLVLVLAPIGVALFDRRDLQL